MNVAALTPTPSMWEPFGLDRLRYVPATSGCYVLTTYAGEILYVGLATNLRARLEQHLDSPEKRGVTPHGTAQRVYWLETVEREALERGWLNLHLLVAGALPVLNKVNSPVSC